MSLSTLLKNLATPGKQPVGLIVNEKEFTQASQLHSLNKIAQETLQMKSLLSYPLVSDGGNSISICFFSRRPGTYTTEHSETLRHLQPILLKIIAQHHPDKYLVNAKIDSETPISLTHNKMGESTPPVFQDIIGKSHLLLNVFDQITQVAPFDTSVLLLGESGTGKERIADSIHNSSPRKEKPFVKVNCAALPATLIESELFGHEKGSFTGASEKRKGKFEQANGGTIFLDEIGEMPIDLQVKLLRVLQEKEIEPVGGKAPVKIDVRIIAATNKNLEKEVAEGRFRLDLYYRLNVFPVELPPLRERSEDIPALANHFINYYNHKAGRKITGLSDKVLKTMMSYHWPGNIRELENIIERSVLLAKGTLIEEISLPLFEKKDDMSGNRDSYIKTIHENERDYIINVLKKCNGRIWGAGGAAEILNIPPTTLTSKMKKLGIQKENI